MGRRNVTVIEVARAMKVEMDPATAWSVGAAVREEYRARHDGALPPKALRPKTNGGGSHCFAVYPPAMRPFIEEAIRTARVEKARQGDLFG